MSNSNVEIVDDRDPRVKYSDGWVLSGSNHEFGGTTHGTFLAGSQATFTFNGSSVEVYGTKAIDHKDPPVSTYSLDGSSPQTFDPPLPDAIQYQQLFFKSPTLDDKQHILVVTSTVSETVFWLDYFRIASNSVSAPLSDPASSITPTSLLTFSPSASGTPPSAPTSTSKLPISRSLIAAIAGGAIGGVLLVLSIFFLVFCYRRKRRSQKAALGSIIQPDGSSSSAIRQVSVPDDQERGNTRFLGAVSPFTIHQGSVSEHSTTSIGFPSELIGPRDIVNPSYIVTASGKTMRSERLGENPRNQDLPPRYSLSRNTPSLDSVY